MRRKPSNDGNIHQGRYLQASLLVFLSEVVSLLHWQPKTQGVLVILTEILAVQVGRMPTEHPGIMVIKNKA